jgi:hypothetical protein
VPILIVPDLQAFLIRAFPEQTWAMLVKGLRDGIAKADRHAATTPMFAGEIGQDLRGHIRRMSILHEFQMLSKQGYLPYEAEPEKMPVGAWHWLNIRSAGLIAHIVRTETPDALPPGTANRQELCVTNQYDLLRDGRIPPVEMVITKARYANITFGVDQMGTLTHVSLGMPNADNTQWLAFVKLARRVPKEPPVIVPVAPLSPAAADGLEFVPGVAEKLAESATNENDEKSA